VILKDYESKGFRGYPREKQTLREEGAEESKNCQAVEKQQEGRWGAPLAPFIENNQVSPFRLFSGLAGCSYSSSRSYILGEEFQADASAANE
jgi:hypothetical protein